MTTISFYHYVSVILSQMEFPAQVFGVQTEIILAMQLHLHSSYPPPHVLNQ